MYTCSRSFCAWCIIVTDHNECEYLFVSGPCSCFERLSLARRFTQLNISTAIFEHRYFTRRPSVQCDRTDDDHFITDLQLSLHVKQFWTQVNIGKVTGKNNTDLCSPCKVVQIMCCIINSQCVCESSKNVTCLPRRLLHIIKWIFSPKCRNSSRLHGRVSPLITVSSVLYTWVS